MGRNLGPLNIKDSYEGLVQISGSQLTDGSGSLIPSLDVSASFATTATSATTAISASHAIIADSALTATSASHALNADNAISSSYAVTASFALNAGASTLQEVLDAGNTATQDFNLTGSVDIVGNLDLGGTGNSISGVLGSAIVVGSNQTISGGGDGGIYSGRGNTISSGLFGATLGGDGNTNSHNRSVVIGGTGLSTTKDDEVVVPSLVANSITASFASFQSASIGYLQTVTGSATIIGDAFIILNNDTPTQRFAGLKVYDSGSANVTASLQWDGLTHDWKYEYSSSAEHEGGVLLTGPEGDDLATLPYPANNAIQKGTGTHHLASSSMTDDGTLVTINANVSASGYVSASAFIGDGSQITGLVTDPFPYTGSADITGSLNVIGNASIGGENNTISSTGFDNVILNDSGSITGTASHSFIAAGGEEDASTIDSGIRNSIISTRNGTITGGARNSAIIAGLGNSITGTRQSIILGSRSSNITTGGLYGQAILGARSATLSGENAVILGGFSNIASAAYTAVVGGQSNTASTINSAVMGGQGNTAAGNQATVVGGFSNDATATQAFIAGGGLSDVTAQRGAVVGGYTHNVAAEDGVCIGGYDNNVLATHARSVVLGGTLLSTTKADEVVVPSLTTNGQVTGVVNTLTDAAGTTTMDCSLGNFFTLTMPAGGSTTLTPSNITAGQTINVKITQNATPSTIAFAATVDFEGGTPFAVSTGAGEVDVMTFISFDGTTLQATGLKNFS